MSGTRSSVETSENWSHSILSIGLRKAYNNNMDACIYIDILYLLMLITFQLCPGFVKTNMSSYNKNAIPVEEGWLTHIMKFDNTGRKSETDLKNYYEEKDKLMKKYLRIPRIIVCYRCGYPRIPGHTSTGYTQQSPRCVCHKENGV